MKIQNSITDAVNTARNNTVSVIMSSGGDPKAILQEKAVWDKLQSIKSMFDTLLKA